MKRVDDMGKEKQAYQTETSSREITTKDPGMGLEHMPGQMEINTRASIIL